MIIKEYFGYLSLCMGILGNGLYLRAVLSKQIRPHAFSWIIWGLITGIAFFAQHVEGAGAGAWATGFTAAACFFVAVWALLHGEKNITGSDWATLAAALATVPLWYITHDPLSAVVLIVIIDALGYWPTFRKSWLKPREEVLSMYILSTVKFILALMAMERYSLVTVTYPLSIVITNTVFVAMALWRRHVMELAG